MLKINDISINNIGPIQNLKLKFDSHFNIICGQNGIGKTTILDCLAQSFGFNKVSVKRSAKSQRGEWVINIKEDGRDDSIHVKTAAFHPKEKDSTGHGAYQSSNNVIVFKTHRDIPYKNLTALQSDPDKDIHKVVNETVHGTLPDNLKNWFVNRHLWSAHVNHLNENQIKNINLAKESFNLLNSDISFSRVNPDSNDIMLNTHNGEIYFEYLSSGYKSCIAVIIGLIKEIEYRFKNPSKYIKDYTGVVFIDEIDLHLHPEWQAKIYDALKIILPKAQIFTSTHSPHIIQVAKPNEIIPLIVDSNNSVKHNPIINAEYGCQGWTVEEILADIMGMTETRTLSYVDIMQKFNNAIDDEDFKTAASLFKIIDTMLHPNNSLRKILRIQLTGISDD